MEGKERDPGDKVFVARWKRFIVKSLISRPKLLTSRNGPVVARQSISGLYEFFTPPSVTSFCHFVVSLLLKYYNRVDLKGRWCKPLLGFRNLCYTFQQ